MMRALTGCFDHQEGVRKQGWGSQLESEESVGP